jgi:hypothetical protein
VIIMHVGTWKSTLADDKIRRAAAAALYDPWRQRGSKGGAIKVISSTAHAHAHYRSSDSPRAATYRSRKATTRLAACKSLS